jgi:hypothetical protein
VYQRVEEGCYVRVGGCYCVGIVKLVSSVYSITLFTD